MSSQSSRFRKAAERLSKLEGEIAWWGSREVLPDNADFQLIISYPNDLYPSEGCAPDFGILLLLFIAEGIDQGML